MAKKSKEIPTDRMKILEEVAERIVAKMKHEIFEVEGAPNGTIKFTDGSYKVKPIMGGWELVVEDVYIGKSGMMIFIFGIMDNSEPTWQHIEFKAASADTAMPMFGPAVRDKMAPNCPSEGLPEVIDYLMDIVRSEHAAEAAENAKVAENTYINNPLFGRF